MSFESNICQDYDLQTREDFSGYVWFDTKIGQTSFNLGSLGTFYFTIHHCVHYLSTDSSR